MSPVTRSRSPSPSENSILMHLNQSDVNSVHFNNTSIDSVDNEQQEKHFRRPSNYEKCAFKSWAICGSLALSFTTIIILMLKNIFDAEFISESSDQIQAIFTAKLDRIIELQKHVEIFNMNLSSTENMNSSSIN